MRHPVLMGALSVVGAILLGLALAPPLLRALIWWWHVWTPGA